jgi:hypothetical protein
MQLETGCIARPTVEDLVEHAHIAHAYAQLRSRTNKIGAVKATVLRSLKESDSGSHANLPW